MSTLQGVKTSRQENGKERTSVCYETDPRWLAVLRVTESEQFVKAARLCQFLLYIAECSLSGRTEQITEQQIGVHVFGKPTTYNPSDDTIVRATARQLRQRLAVYYQEAEDREPIKITIPRGGYLPIFTSEEPAFHANPTMPQESTVTSSPDDSVPVSVSPSAAPPHKNRQMLGWSVLFGVALTGFLYLILHTVLWNRSPSDILWRQLFNRGHQTLIVAGDAGLNIFENLSKHEVGLDEYSSRSYLKSPEAQTPPGFSWDPLATRTYTTFQDLRLASQFTALAGSYSATAKIRFARELSIEDLKESNAILLGSPQYDPWEHLLEAGLIFTINYDGVANTITIDNHSPQRGEQSRYVWSPSNPADQGYALITLTNNLSGNGKVLLIQGTTAAGDDAAGDFLSNEQTLGGVLKFAEDRFGRLHNFQLLIATTMTGGDSHASRLIAERVLNN